MEQKYLVVTGNEYGLDLPTRKGNRVGLMEYKPAKTLFDKYVLSFGVAVMYELTSDGLLVVKSENSF